MKTHRILFINEAQKKILLSLLNSSAEDDWKAIETIIPKEDLVSLNNDDIELHELVKDYPLTTPFLGELTSLSLKMIEKLNLIFQIEQGHEKDDTTSTSMN